MNRHHLIPIILGLTLAAIILLVSSIGDAQAEDARLHLNFKEDVSLTPETDPTEEGPYPAIMVNADYMDVGGVRLNKQWVDIETWTSDDRDANMSITFETLNFFYTIPDEGYDANPELRITLLVDGGQIFQDTHAFTDFNDDEFREEFFSFPEILYRVAHNETLECQLEYSGYEDLGFSYDHRDRDAGLTAVTDFLYTWNMSARDREVVLEVGDIFQSDWEAVGNFINLSVDGVPRNNQSFTVEQGGPHNESGFIINSSNITWELDSPLLGGQEVEMWIKYIDADPGANLGMRKNVTADQGNLKKPVAEITSIDPETSYEGDEISFDASGSWDDDGSVEWYRWESDRDGVLYDGDNADFVLSNLSVGVHGITLKVRDDDELWSEEVEDEIEVMERSENEVPTVDLLSPGDGSVVELTEVTLSWEGEDGDDDDLWYDVYLDDTSDPQTMIAEDITDEAWDLTDLENGTYYWKVVVSDGTDEAESDIWSFTVELPQEPENAPPTVLLLAPENASQLDPGQVLLGWKGEDDDGDDLVYDLWMGSNPDELILVAGDLSAMSYTSSGLLGGATYYWSVEVHDGTDTGYSETWQFSIASDGGGDGDDDDFEIAGINGYAVIALIAVIVIIIVVAVFMYTRGGEWEDEEYDNEEYDDW